MFTDVISSPASKASLKPEKTPPLVSYSRDRSTGRRRQEVLTKEVQEGVYISVCVLRRVPDLSGPEQMLGPHLESLSRPVRTDKTPVCQEIKACLVDSLELGTI